MGEIGYPRQEYLYDLTFCDMLMIERGYDSRHSHIWSTSRWSTYYLLSAFCGGENLSKSGIHSPHDLLPLPWDNTDDDEPTDNITKEDVEQLRQLMREENDRLSAQAEK